MTQPLYAFPGATDLLTIELEHLTRLPDGRAVEWEALGQGEPLVWIEGGPGLPAHLARADVEPVLDRFRCHLVNAPGCGRTSPPARVEDHDLRGHVEFWEAVRNALGLEPVTVMGHSWGGLVASAWAALHPEAVRRLIVVDGLAGNGSVDLADADTEQQRALDRLRERPWFDEAYAAYRLARSREHPTEADDVATFRAELPFYFAEPDSEVSRVHITRLRREMRINEEVNDLWFRKGGWMDADYRPLFGSIACPTLVMVGEHDWMCGPTWGRSLAAAIPNAELVVLPGQGHLPQYEAPALFRSTIGGWLERQ